MGRKEKLEERKKEYEEIAELGDSFSDDFLDKFAEKTANQVGMFLTMYGDVNSYADALRLASTVAQSGLLWLWKNEYITPSEKALATDEERTERKEGRGKPVDPTTPHAPQNAPRMGYI